MEPIDPLDHASQQLPFFDAHLGWAPTGEAATFQDAFETGQSYGNAFVAFLKRRTDTPPNFLYRIALDQSRALPEDALHPERGYVAGFWERIQAYLRQA
jgi:hypothetical protein